MKPSGAHTHPPSGGSLAVAIAVAVIAATAAGPVVQAVAALLRAVLLIVAAAVVLVVAALAAVAVYRVRHPRPARPPWLAARAITPQASSPSPPAALNPAAIPAIHLHLYGMSAQDVAQVLARPSPPATQRRGDGHAAP